MYRFLLLFLFLIVNGINRIAAQTVPTLISPNAIKELHYKEDTLKDFAFYLLTDSLPEERMVADSVFTRTLVRALQIPFSFYYPFDSVLGISKMYAPDSSFRIITWNLQYNDYYNRQRGAIQINTKDGKLKLFPLRDASEFTDRSADSVRSTKNWIGALYYRIIKKEEQGKPFYTLFGLDPNNAKSTIKWIEVLHFSNQGEPLFGGPFFSYAKDSVPKETQMRVSLEYKKNTRVLMDYIPELDMILMDHLISENDDVESPWTFVPDGDQEGFKWEKGRWLHINKVFNHKLEDGKAPRELPILETPSQQKIPALKKGN
ncbi:MAG: hypothetical protein FJY19_05255 [Bacteroidetes bacterium]|nr:hypothetical protein [Bacteroidota bacterium]